MKVNGRMSKIKTCPGQTYLLIVSFYRFWNHKFADFFQKTIDGSSLLTFLILIFSLMCAIILLGFTIMIIFEGRHINEETKGESEVPLKITNGSCRSKNINKTP